MGFKSAFKGLNPLLNVSLLRTLHLTHNREDHNINLYRRDNLETGSR